MNIHKQPIEWYVDRMRRGEYFAFPGYSDAEWYSITGKRNGCKTALGQIINRPHGLKLLDVLRRRCADPRWLFAIPEVLFELPSFCDGYIDVFLKSCKIGLRECYERDIVTDTLAESAGLFPLIRQVREMKVAMIGPEELYNPMQSVVRPEMFVGIPTPNLHMDEDELSSTVDVLLDHASYEVYLISAGVSAPVIIDRLYEYNPHAFYFDCGSIWDAFAGIGGQREWRAKLYENPNQLERWKRSCCYGVPYESGA